MNKGLGVAILAAGQGTRLKLAVPKVLAPVLGKKLIDFPVQETQIFQKQHNLEVMIGIVVGHKREEVEAHIKSSFDSQIIKFAIQEKQLGTADAIRSYFQAIPSAQELEYTMVICGDTPLIRSSDMSVIFDKLVSSNSNAVAATFKTTTPHGYGRIVRGGVGFSIVEEKDATDEQKKIQEVNSGFYLFKTDYLLKSLAEVNTNNKAKEYYLTDVFQKEANVTALEFKNANTFLGVNTLFQLSEIEELLLLEKMNLLMDSGVQLIRPKSSYIEWDVLIEPEAVIYQNVSLRGKTKIGKGSKIEEGCVIKDSTIGEKCDVKNYSVLEDCIMQMSSSAGPFARLRPKTVLEVGVKVGNFVEIKKATMRKGSKASHLSYIGDADIGERTNLGCGFITCNYDGANKHFTKIGSDSFIGSDTQVIAPVEIGNECFVASGSTITGNMPDGSFAISRMKQTTKDGMAKRFIKKKD